MTPSPTASLCLASLPEYPTLWESLQFQLTGLIVVFIALGSIWGLMEIMGWAFRRLAITQAATPSTAASPIVANEASPAPVAEPAEIPVEIFVIIAAAVHVMTDGKPHRIVTVTPHDPSFDWAREGRRAIFASHKTH
jgi:hypothetical protein